jgi:hypothetical protein
MSKAMPACSKSLEKKKSGSASPVWLGLVAALLVLPLNGFLSSRAHAISAINAEQAVRQWDLSLTDPRGRFDLVDNGGLLAVGPRGETYRLVVVAQADQNAGAASAEPKVPGFEVVQVAASSRHRAAADAAKPSDVAGRYSILRAGGKDTGCMLTLDDHARAGGENRASLAPACRDEGMVIFDPTGWQIVAGRLVLTARKGHTTHLDRQEDGSWAKDSQEGKALILKKM